MSLVRIARIVQIIPGLVLLLAGGFKVWDPVAFYWTSMPYSQLMGVKPASWPTVGRLVQFLSPLEFGLGIALILNWRPRISFPAGTLLMAFFAGLTFRYWQLGGTDNCGCFGTLIERTPGQAVVVNSILLLALIFSWWATRSIASSGLSESFRSRVVRIGTGAAALVCAFRFIPDMDRLEGSDLQVGESLELAVQGIESDLAEGEYLVELFSPNCKRCRNTVPKLNSWSEISGLPPIVALSHYKYESPYIQEFRQTLRPRFKMGTISLVDFRRLTWKAGYPRLAYVKNGKVKAVWEHFEMPTAEQLKSLTEL